MGLCKVPPEWGYVEALAKSTDPSIGIEIGNFIYYDDYCCEITAKIDNRVQLVGVGWKDLNECRFKE